MGVQVVKDPDGVAELASASIARWLAGQAGSPTLGLAGGGTPRATYARLREEEVAWDRVHLWLGDERWVAPDDSESNSRMVRDTLADHVPATFHEVPWGGGVEPAEAAAIYESTLATALTTGEDGRPVPDVVLLGIGDDGHTASLFPGSSALDERERSYAATWVENKGVWRLTATLPLLWSARRIAFLVTGPTKAGTVAEILEGSSLLPAAQVAGGAHDVTWFLDEAAASRLSPKTRRPI